MPSLPDHCPPPGEAIDSIEERASVWTAAHGQRLREARLNAGLSQEKVEADLGFATRSLTRWENGVCDPGYGKVIRLAELYGVSLDWIAGRTSIQRVLDTGKAIVRTQTVEVLKQLVEQGKRITDLPETILRKPGVDVGFIIPNDFEVMSADAARHVAEEAHRLFQQLRR